MAIDSRRWPEAVRLLQGVLKLDPANVTAKSHLDDAERRVRASALIDEGRAAHGAGKWEEAVASFREAATLDPDFTDEDGLLADASWRVDVLRQPTEPPKEPVVVSAPLPEPAVVTPSAPSFEPAPTPPAPSVRPPVYEPRRRVSAGLIFTLVIVIGFPIFFVLWAIGQNDGTTTTTNQTATTVTEASVTTLGLPAAEITAQRMTSQVTIDAEFTEWAAAESTVSGVEVFPGATQGDLPSGHWWVGWDDVYLYVFVDVTDATSVASAVGVRDESAVERRLCQLRIWRGPAWDRSVGWPSDQ